MMSHSGTLTCETVGLSIALDLGQLLAVGIGAESITAGSTSRHEDVQRNLETDAVIMIGKIGGSDDEANAAYWHAVNEPSWT